MKKTIEFQSSGEAVNVCGPNGENVRLLGEEFPVSIVNRGSAVVLEGGADAVEAAGRVFSHLIEIARGGRRLHSYEVRYIARAVGSGEDGKDMPGVFLDRIEVSSKRRDVSPKTRGQKIYVDAIRNNDVVFGIGPAGTGKTYLAVAMAVSCLKRREVDRIILTRPAVEAGESLGFLPGDLFEKVTPYLRPLYDALYDMMEVEAIQKHLDQGVIEIAPLAYMRGRTLNDAFIILDEAQNSTSEQMKMFLTRLGFGSRTVITGDITQVDLPRGRVSGLSEAVALLGGIEGIKFVHFSGRDVVRHQLVQEIIKAYDKKEHAENNDKKHPG